MSSTAKTTFGKYQLTEAIIFALFLLAAESIFLYLSQLSTTQVFSKALQTPACPWDVTRQAVTPEPTSANLLANPSAEQFLGQGNTPMSWNANSWGNNISQHHYTANDARTGEHSLMVEINQFVDGDAKWEPGALSAAKPSTAYLFQTHYRSDVTTYAVAEFVLSDQSRMYINLGSIPASSSWRVMNNTFITPSNVKSINAYQILSQPGFLQTDDYYLGEYQANPLAKGLVSLTFDDGAKTIYQYALPLMQKHQVVSTQYVLSGPLLDRYNSFYLTREQVADFIASGHEIGSHTVSHDDLAKISTTAVSQQITGPKVTLYSLYNLSVINFATPYGSYTSDVIQQVRKHYCSHRSTEAGFNSPDNFDVYNIKVQNVEVDTPTDTIATWIDYAANNRVWLVLLFHEIEPSGGQYSYSPSNFEKILQHLESESVGVVTMTEGIKAMY